MKPNSTVEIGTSTPAGCLVVAVGTLGTTVRLADGLNLDLSAFQPLNTKLANRLDSVLIADINGNGTADVLRIELKPSGGGICQPQANCYANWQVSWEGRSEWRPLVSMAFPLTLGIPFFPLIGRFDPDQSADLLLVDQYRSGHFTARRPEPTGS